MPTDTEYALMASNAYASARASENTTPIPPGWSLIIDNQSSNNTGFLARVYQRGNEIVIAYAGTTPGPADWVNGNVPAW